MKHYDYIEWMLYKNGMLSEEKSEEMEQHLYNCNTCMEIFLSLVDQDEEEKAGEIISDDFTSKVISKIPKVRNVKKKKQRQTFYYQFGYYAAVASVTIILTLGGIYGDLVDAVPKISASIEITRERPNKIVDFSTKIVDSTSSILFSIENIDLNNRRENNER